MIEYRQTEMFERIVREREEQLNALHTELEAQMASGADRISLRLQNPRLKTTSVAVREAALKKSMVEKLDKLVKLAPELAELIYGLHLDEIELGLVMDQRRQNACEYWKRLADGKVYAGGRAFLDLLHHRGISATALASLNQAETHEITTTIQHVLEKKWSGRKSWRDEED